MAFSFDVELVKFRDDMRGDMDIKDQRKDNLEFDDVSIQVSLISNVSTNLQATWGSIERARGNGSDEIEMDDVI
jgi:hypothetical protein